MNKNYLYPTSIIFWLVVFLLLLTIDVLSYATMHNSNFITGALYTTIRLFAYTHICFVIYDVLSGKAGLILKSKKLSKEEKEQLNLEYKVILRYCFLVAIPVHVVISVL